MDEYINTPDDQQYPLVKELSSIQRRVLGTLIEKAMTTPDQYPMTIKGATTGCNQKSNREPVVNYREDDVFRVLEELRELGLVAVVLTGGGRTERYRHYVRKRFPFSEPQIAIMTELWLRGRQQLGELRTRASRMVPIESLDALRTELENLLSGGFIQANGSLDRRGIEVDHNFYRPAEGKLMTPYVDDAVPSVAPARPVVSQPTALHSTAARSEAPQSVRPVVAAAVGTGSSSHVSGASDTAAIERELAQLKAQQSELQDEVATLQEQVSELVEIVQMLKRDLGV